MKVLLLGTGAALHALVWKLVSEPQVERVWCSPGNAGTTLLVGRPPFPPQDRTEAVQWAFTERVDLVVVQGMPGWVDALSDVGLSVLGVGVQAWQSLRSRQGIRDLLHGRPVPCVEGGTFRDLEAAERYMASRPLPLWIRSDSTAQREAIRVEERFDAFQHLPRLLSLDPQAGVSVEEALAGPVVTLALLCDGDRAISFGVGRPYDRRYEGETGPVTDGMGMYAPYGNLELEELLMAEVGRPLVAALAASGLLRPCFLQLRIILSERGPVLRDLFWGLDDLHAAVTLPRWPGELIEPLAAAAERRLVGRAPIWEPGVAVAVAVVGEGYPSSFPEGQPLPGLYDVEALVFHHATVLQVEVEVPAAGPLSSWLGPVTQPGPAGLARPVLTAGGRVFVAVRCAATREEAFRAVYEGLARATLPRCAWRKDIAVDPG